MEMDVEQGRLWLRSLQELPTLQDLVDGITPENVHDEQVPNLIGRERW